MARPSKKAAVAATAEMVKPTVSLAAGDVVTLKSGGIPLTVVALVDYDDMPASEVEVAWFDHKELERAILPMAALKAYDLDNADDGIPF